MNDIHSPTVVPSGPTSSASALNGIPQEKVPLMDLIAEKSRVEEELKALGSVLDSVCHLYHPPYFRSTIHAKNDADDSLVAA